MNSNSSKADAAVKRADVKISPGLMVHVKGDAPEKDGAHVGMVEHLDGSAYIKLAREASGDGEAHWIPMDWAESSDDNALFLNVDEQTFKEGLLNKLPH